MALVDLDGLYLQVNPALCSFVGFAPDDLVGTHHLNLTDAANLVPELTEMGRLVRGEIPSLQMEIRYRHCNGDTVWGWLSVALLQDGAGQPVGFIKQVIDTTERKQQQEALQRSEQSYRQLYEQFRVLFEGIPDPLLLMAPDLRIDWVNAAAMTAFGSPGAELVGSYCYEVFHNRLQPCESCEMPDCFRLGITHEHQVTTLAGDLWNFRGFPIFDQAGQVRQVLFYCQEVGSRLQAQAEAIRSSQLASLGELAAGVAHEINNPLNGIINYAQMLHNRFSADDRNREITERLLREGSRIAAIVGSLLAFARPQKEAKRPVVLAGVLQDCLTLAGVQLHKQGIVLQLDLPEDLPRVVAMPQQLQQVFLNLISNARYALCEKYPENHTDKILEISGEALKLQDGLWVRLTFQDYGTGIPDSIRDKVLNPFFTTKPPDCGTGLGLSISHGIIKDHGGKLQLSSVPGLFTVVTIDLPAEPKSGSQHAS
jgi:PAS domain S-box-containing protein